MLSGISIWQLLIILIIVMVLFGTKKLRNIGSDLGGAVKGFKDAMKDGEREQEEQQQKRVIEGKAKPEEAGDAEKKEHDQA